MSKKEPKKMTPIHTKYPKASTENIMRVELSDVFPEVQEEQEKALAELIK